MIGKFLSNRVPLNSIEKYGMKRFFTHSTTSNRLFPIEKNYYIEQHYGLRNDAPVLHHHLAIIVDAPKASASINARFADRTRDFIIQNVENSDLQARSAELKESFHIIKKTDLFFKKEYCKIKIKQIV